MPSTTLSFTADRLPQGETLYTTLWTQVAGVWRAGLATTFETVPEVATLTAPLNGARSVGSPTKFQWDGVVGAENYYLYVGTSPGAKDVVDTGEVPNSSLAYTVANLPPGQTLYATLWTESGDVWYAGSTISFSTMPLLGILTAPAPGAKSVPLTEVFQWSQVANAQGYYLYVGTISGAQDVVDSGELPPETSSLTANLPPQQALYATLWTQVNGLWLPGATVSFVTTPAVGILTAPADGAQAIPTSCTFDWTGPDEAQGYYLYVGSTPGAKDVGDSGMLSADLHSWAESLPPGQTLYPTLWTMVGGVWYPGPTTQFITMPPSPALTEIADGATCVPTDGTIRWSPIPGAQGFRLLLGSSPGASDLFDSGLVTGTSAAVAGLPPGRKVYATLEVEFGGSWYSTPSSFTTMPLVAELLSPADGDMDVATTASFAWTAVADSTGYYLYVGTAPGKMDLFDSKVLSQDTLSMSVPALPSGSQLYATIWTQLEGVWYASGSSFATEPQLAGFNSIADGATAIPLSGPISWDGVPGAQGYRLQLGSGTGGSDIFDSGVVTSTSVDALDLPPDQLIFATLQTEINGQWYSQTISFTTEPLIAQLISPGDGASDVGQDCVFSWDGISGAQGYYLYVGTSAGASDLVDSNELSPDVTSWQAYGLPFDQRLNATLWTEIGGVWYPQASTFTTAPQIAALTSPGDGASAVAVDAPIMWEAVPGAQGYRLWLGSAPGGTDFADSGAILDSRYDPGALAYDSEIYATLWTEVNGTWYASTSSFKTAPQMAVLTIPVDGQTAVDTNAVLAWTPVAGAEGYYLYLGSSPGASDLLDTREMDPSTLSYTSLGLPSGTNVYATLWTKQDGTWWPLTSSFRTQDAPATPAVQATQPAMVYPADGSVGIDGGKLFTWNDLGPSSKYWLWVGTSPSTDDVFSSGSLDVPASFVPNLPVGTPLFGTLFVLTGATWNQSAEFEFSAASNTITDDTARAAAFWATDYVRQMADDESYVAEGSLLRALVYPSDRAVCFNYSEALLQILAEMKMPLSTRILNVALDPNGYDGHTLVEYLDPGQQEWELLDPTFDLTVTRTADGSWATAEDMMNATRSQQWGQIGYVFLGAGGDVYARENYLDYPLLFLNVYHLGQPIVPGIGPSILPYFTAISSPAYGYGPYAIRCLTTPSLQFLDTAGGGNVYTVSCDGIDSFSYIFRVDSVVPLSGEAAFELYVPNRYVF
ncbi:MAG TPA: hypothetical protein VHD32_05485 [Candidatus Didemnitutus sp.]|nr:hypothetical protein [Candidatus Didemnitutus sp.]